MGKKNNAGSPDVITGFDAKIPENMKSMEYPQKVSQGMKSWLEKHKKNRAFLMVVNSECEDSEAGAECVAIGGNLSVIAGAMIEAYENDPHFRKVMQTVVPALCDKYGIELMI